MIEIRQGGKRENEEEVQASCQPKNFRQIGTPQGMQKIYFEDYVYTYLHPSVETMEETRVCILLGRVEKENNTYYIFINGAIELTDVNFAKGVPIFTEKTRQEICTLIKRHFDGLYLVGWYLDVKGSAPKLTPELERIHRNFFGGKNKILLLMDTLNREEKIFAYDGNAIWQRDGYYIYYEKNPIMQDYMISNREQMQNTIEPEEVVDEALKNYRELLLNKEKIERPRSSIKWKPVLYTTSLLVVVSLCVLSANMISNYSKMKDMEGALSVISNALQNEGETEDATENLVIVETVKGNVTPETEKSTESTESTEKSSTETSKVPEETETENETIDEKEESTELSEAETIKLQGYYIVQKGDNLAAISRKIYQTTDMMQAICDVNNIENSDEIFAGQKLMLP